MATFVKVLRKFDYRNRHGQQIKARPGTIIDLVNKQQYRDAQARGLVVPLHTPANDTYVSHTPVECKLGRRHVLIVMRMSRHYSGGRIHIWQYAWCLAKLGNVVTICCDFTPPWADDYPALPNLRCVTHPPETFRDVDLVVTEVKHPQAREAERLALQRRVPLVVWNFEDPDWCGQYDKDLEYQYRDQDNYKDLAANCDLVICNSAEAARHFDKWVGEWRKSRTVVLPPAVNTHAVEQIGVRRPSDVVSPLRQRKYVVTCARGSGHKQLDLAWEAVKACPGPLDLVCIGSGCASPAGGDQDHKLHHADRISDVDKFVLMRHAQAVLCPSKFEGYGMVPDEAQAVSTPVIAWDIPVMRDRGCTLVDSADAFTAALQGLLDDRPAPDRTTHTHRNGLDRMQNRIDNLPWHYSQQVKISAVMNAWYCAPFVRFAIRSVYDHCHEIIIAIGREQIWDWPDDGTSEELERIAAEEDPDGKITLVHMPGDIAWGDSEEECRQSMRRACVERMTGNYLLILDADEIWTGFENYVQALQAGRIQGGAPLAVTPWHDAEHHIVTPGRPARWGQPVRELRAASAGDRGVQGCIWPHMRVIGWRYSYQWALHVYCKTAHGQPVWTRDDNVATVHALKDSCVLYHIGHALPRERMEVKKNFYAEVEGHVKQRDAWLNWDGELGDCGDGIVEPITWALPAIVVEAMDAARGHGPLEPHSGCSASLPPAPEHLRKYEREGRYSQNDEERIILDWLTQHDIAPAAVRFLDVGAYDGLLLSNTRRLAELGASGVFIEPSPLVYPRLRENVAQLWNITSRQYDGKTYYTPPQAWVCVQVAIGTKTGRLPMHCTDDAVSTLRPEEVERWRGEDMQWEVHEVDVITWSDLLNVYGDDFTLLDLDVEGLNLDLFEALPCYRLELLRLIVVEHDGHRAEMEAIARRNGFRKIHSNAENLIFAR